MERATDTPTSLVIAAHGERGGERADGLVHHLVERLRSARRFSAVDHAFISKPPALDSVLSCLPRGPVGILPLFMSDGYFVKKAIPGAIARYRQAHGDHSRQVFILPPAGLDAGLPGIVSALAHDGARQAGNDPRTVHVILIAHGSRHDPASRNATEQVSRQVASLGAFAGVCTGYLEEKPFIGDVLETVPGPAVAVGLFAGDGMHGAVDLPQAITASGRRDLVLAPPLTRSQAFIDLVCDQTKAAACPQSEAAE